MPIRINETTIGCLTIGRLSPLGDERDEYQYIWELAMNDAPDLRGRTRPDVQRGNVRHDYNDGAVALIKKVMEQIQ